MSQWSGTDRPSAPTSLDPNRLLVQLGAGIVACLLVWQLATVWVAVPTVLLPSPLAVARTVFTHAETIIPHVVYTGYEIVVSWSVGIGIGVAFASAMVASERLRTALYPALLTLRIVPLVVVAPLLLMAFGTTFGTRVLIAVTMMFFPVTVATVEGLRATPATQIALAKSIGMSRWQRVARIRLPNAVPRLFAGLKIATPVAVQGVILAEFLAAERGVGHQLLETAQQFQTALLFGYIGVLLAFSVVLFGAVTWVERRFSWNEGYATGIETETARSSTGHATTNVLGVAATLAIATGLWQAGTATVDHAILFLPRPGRIAATLASMSGLFVSAGAQTVMTFVVGWFGGALLGSVLGIVAGVGHRVRQPLLTTLVGVRAVPDIAVVPLLLIWLRVSFEAAVVLVVLSTFYPITVGVAAGLRSMPARQADLLVVVAAPLRYVLRVRARYALPSLFAGVKLSVIAGVTSTVIAEWFVAERGLGLLILQGMTNYQPTITYAAAFCLAALGLVLFGTVATIHRALTW